jgi:hypothetical protein
VLDEPECKYGYPIDQAQRVLGDRYEDYCAWARGSTGAICDGREYDHDQREYHPTGCGPHGMVVYRWDVEKFLAGLPQDD